MSHASSLTSTQRSPSATSAKRHLPRRLLGATLWGAATLVAVASHGEPKPEASGPPSAATVNRLRERVREIVLELAAACPVRPVDDRAAYEACQKTLFGDSKFRSALKNVVLWGRAPGGNINSKLSAFRSTQFGPDVFTGAYAPMWMVRGDYELEFDTNNGVMRAFVPAGFRNELPTGSYPYPFWHDAKKWTDYEDANTLVFWLDASSLKISQITFMKRDNAAKVAASTRRHMPTFDGKWMWVDAKGQTQPAPTLFAGLFAPQNPHLRSLDETYRAFALTMRDADCNSCHVPNNPDKMRRLVLLQTPLHAASEVERVIRSVKSDRMPLDESGVAKDLPAPIKTKLLAHAEAFAKDVRAAKKWERDRTARGRAGLAASPGDGAAKLGKAAATEERNTSEAAR